MGDWIRQNLPCPDCGSSDALQESTHHFKCFSCGASIKKREHTMTEQIEPVQRQQFNRLELLHPGNVYPIKSRNITKETAEKLRITSTKYTGNFGHGVDQVSVADHWVFVFNRYKDGKLTSQKIRSTENKKWMTQRSLDEKNTELYGQWLNTPNPQRFVVITEGEFDTAAVVQETGFSCVSVNNGIAGAMRDIKNNIEWLSSWAYVVLAFDNDKPAQEALEKILEANLFEPGKLRIAYWPLKDANDLLIAGRGNEIKKVIWDAQEYKPNDIVTPSDCIDAVLNKPKSGVKTPWTTLTTALMGWRPNTITTIAGPDGIGKSELNDEIISDLLKQKVKTWLYSCEQEPEDSLRRQAGKVLEVPLHVPGAKWDEDAIKKTVLSFEDTLYLWRPEKAVTMEDFFAKMRYANIAFGVKIFLLDHLKAIDSQLADNFNTGMGKFMAELKRFVKTYNVTAILYSHVAKNKKQGKAGQEDESWNRGRVPTKEDIFGSSGITAWSDNIIALSRNVESADDYEASITKLTILKNRLMGNRNQRLLHLQYLPDCGKLIEIPMADYEAYFADEPEELTDTEKALKSALKKGK